MDRNSAAVSGVTIDSNAIWTLRGRSEIHDRRQHESAEIGSGADLEVTGGLSGAASFHLTGGKLHISGFLDSLTTFDLSSTAGGAANLLQLDAVSGTSLVDAVTGFSLGDRIDLPNVTFAAVPRRRSVPARWRCRF